MIHINFIVLANFAKYTDNLKIKYTLIYENDLNQFRIAVFYLYIGIAGNLEY